MKILHCHDAPHIHGGATIYLRRLLGEMSSRGFSAAVFSVDEPATGLASDLACFRYSWPRSSWRRRRDFHGFHPPLAEAITRFAKVQRPDLVHVQNFTAFRSTVFPTLGELGLPVVMTVHDFTLSDPNPARLARDGWTGVVKRALDRSSLRRARRCVFKSVDLFLCPTIALQHGIAIPASLCRLLRLPIDPAPESPLPSGPLRLFFAGTLYRSKGVDILLQALSQASGPVSSASLEIAGAGDQRAPLEALAERLGLANRVRFLGLLDASGMDAAYRRASLQVLPSRVPENSPLTVLEAGARARPSLASHAGGVPELIDPPRRGWTFPSEDAGALARTLEEIAADPGELTRRGARMREWVRAECDPQRHWDGLAAVYRELAA